jgi:tetratricopeptide (TPR) repeat protein
MTKRTLLILLTLVLATFSACTSASSADRERMSEASLTPTAEALPEAAKLYSERKDPNNVRKALEILQSARNPDKRNFEVESNFAKYSYFLGSRESTDDKEADKVLKEGLVAAQIAGRLEPEKPDGYFWESAIIGEQSKRAPLTVGVISIDKVRDGLNRSIEIDPGFQAASAYLGLGQLELNTRGLAGGSTEKAVEHLEKGLQYSKENGYIYLYLAEAYFAMDKDDEAKKMIAELRALTPDADHLPEYDEALAKAEKLLKDKTL